MPTVREYSEDGNWLKRCKTSSSQRKIKKDKRELEIMELAEKIKINNLNFKGKQAEGMPLTDKIKHLSKMISCNFNHYAQVNTPSFFNLFY